MATGVQSAYNRYGIRTRDDELVIIALVVNRLGPRNRKTFEIQSKKYIQYYAQSDGSLYIMYIMV